MKPRDQFGLDALLGRWPAQDPQEKGGPSWEERAETIMGAALAQKTASSLEAVDALTAPPRLDPEPGEERAASFTFGGEPQPMSSDQPRKPSLKELAARASQTGAARASVTPLPPAARSSAPPPATPATVTPIAKARAARASDAGREDSGVLRLADLQAKEADKAEAAAAAAEAALASATAKRADNQQTAAAATPAASAAGKSNTGMWAGVAIAVVGLAAAFAVYRSQKHETTPTANTMQAPVAPQETAAHVDAPKPKETAQPAAVASSEAAPVTSGAPKAEVAKSTEDAKGAESAAPAPTVVANNEAKPATPADKPLVGSKVGSLDEEMKKAVGQKELEAAPQDDGSKPASGGGGNVPEQPSQGSAQAAVRAVLPAAKACVAGADDVTSASITFGSAGAVQSVTVGGWAASNGKAACVKGALQGAHVSPFAKPTFTVPVNIRP